MEFKGNAQCPFESVAPIPRLEAGFRGGLWCRSGPDGHDARASIVMFGFKRPEQLVAIRFVKELLTGSLAFESIERCLDGPSPGMGRFSCWFRSPAGAEDFYCYGRLHELKIFEEPARWLQAGSERDRRGTRLALSFSPELLEIVLVWFRTAVNSISIRTLCLTRGGGVGPRLGTLREHAIVAIRLPEAPKGEVVTGWLYARRDDGLGDEAREILPQCETDPGRREANVCGRQAEILSVARLFGDPQGAPGFNIRCEALPESAGGPRGRRAP